MYFVRLEQAINQCHLLYYIPIQTDTSVIGSESVPLPSSWHEWVTYSTTRVDRLPCWVVAILLQTEQQITWCLLHLPNSFQNPSPTYFMSFFTSSAVCYPFALILHTEFSSFALLMYVLCECYIFFYSILWWLFVSYYYIHFLSFNKLLGIQLFLSITIQHKILQKYSIRFDLFLFYHVSIHCDIFEITLNID